MLEVCIVVSSGRIVLYTVFIVFPLPQTLVKTPATNLAKNLGGESFINRRRGSKT